jgi:hypothetical protein
MKQVILAIVFMFTTTFTLAETKKVCHDETRNGKQVQVCKTIKVHKKLEGTEVPVKK